MSNNFLPPDPLKEPSNRWHNILGIACVVIAVGIFGTAALSQQTGESQTFSGKIIETLKVVQNLSNKSGGDVEVAPPKIEPPKLPVLQSEMISAEQFTAKGMIVKDHATGAVLFRKNEYTPRPIASITKLMSALVILEKQPDWTATTTVVSDALSDTHMYAGDTYTLQDLWEAGLVGSSNKAIMTLADAVGWPRVAFVERMNQKALELGMTQTRFTEPTGLDEGNVSTPSDIAMLLSHALTFESIETALMQTEKTLYSKERKKNEHMWSTNWLLLGWIPNTLTLHGGKTGFIDASGYNFAMQAENSEKKYVLDVVVLGADVHEARFTEARDIAEWVSLHYRWPDELASTTTPEIQNTPS